MGPTDLRVPTATSARKTAGVGVQPPELYVLPVLVRLGAAEYATAARLDRANKAAAGKLALARELIAPTKPAAPASTATPSKP